jgi:hypothetical protein
MENIGRLDMKELVNSNLLADARKRSCQGSPLPLQMGHSPGSAMGYSFPNVSLHISL